MEDARARIVTLRAAYLSNGAGLGIMFPFMALILFDHGYDVVGVGLVAGVSALVSAFALPILGHVADVVTGRRLALQATAALAAVGLALTLAPITGPVLSACFVVFWVAATTQSPLIDALAVNALSDPRRDYARIRLVGSLGFALAAIAAGFIYGQAGFWIAVPLYVAAMVVLLVGARGVPDVRRADLHKVEGDEAAGQSTADSSGADQATTTAPQSRPRLGSVGMAFRVAPSLPGVLLAIGLIHVTIIGSFTFLTVRLDELGGGSTAVALATGTAALIEVPAFLLAGRLARRLSLATLFVLGALQYSITILSWTVIDNPAIIVVSRAFNGIGYALFFTACVVTIAQLLPRHLQATGQTLFSMVGLGFAALVADIAGGYLWEVGGAALVFGLAGSIGLVATVVGWVVLPRARPSRVEKRTAQPVRR